MAAAPQPRQTNACLIVSQLNEVEPCAGFAANGYACFRFPHSGCVQAMEIGDHPARRYFASEIRCLARSK